MYDAVLFVSFGGPEGPDDVLPFLENVTRGRDIPRDRLESVGEHYFLFDGVSPINAQNRTLVELLRDALAEKGPALPVYWGNRNWHPLLEDTLRQMREDGVKRALAFVTSAFSSYSGCRQYREDLARAAGAVGDGAPEIDKIRIFHNHPAFIRTQATRVRAALEGVPSNRRGTARVVFTAHSIPVAMARTCDYEIQLREACRLVMDRVEATTSTALTHDLVYSSRSGPPHVPWLEPDVNDHLEVLAAAGTTDVVLVPIGFLTDHMEVVYDLDVEAQATAGRLGLHLVRAGTVGIDPNVVEMIRDLVDERVSGRAERPYVGDLGPRPDACVPGCCPNLRAPETPVVAQAR